MADRIRYSEQTKKVGVFSNGNKHVEVHVTDGRMLFLSGFLGRVVTNVECVFGGNQKFRVFLEAFDVGVEQLDQKNVKRWDQIPQKGAS